MIINWNGKKIPVKVSYYAIKKFQEETDSDISQISEKNIALLEVLIWYGIIAGYKSENKVLDVKREDVEWILDDSMTQVFDIISKQVPKANTKKK